MNTGGPKKPGTDPPDQQPLQGDVVDREKGKARREFARRGQLTKEVEEALDAVYKDPSVRRMIEDLYTGNDGNK